VIQRIKLEYQLIWDKFDPLPRIHPLSDIVIGPIYMPRGGPLECQLFARNVPTNLSVIIAMSAFDTFSTK